MAMIAGSVTINPTTGTATGTGAANAIFTALSAAQDFGTLASSNPVAYAAARAQLADIANAVAALVDYIKLNAVVTTTVASGIAVATAGTAAAQTGATTAVGTGTGTVS